MKNKVCKVCENEFPATETFFYINKLGAGGLDNKCKHCRKEYSRKVNLANKAVKNYDAPDGFKKCHKCEEIFPKTDEFFTRSDGYLCSPCRECTLKKKRETDHNYYMKTRDKHAEMHKKWRTENRDRKLEWDRNNYGTPKGRYGHYRNNAKDRHIPFELSFEEFVEFWGKPCVYCEAPIEKIGLDRIDSALGYTVSNIVSCCKHCNYAKRLFSADEYIEHCRKVLEVFDKNKTLRLVVS